MRAAIYARYSSDRQSDKSAEDQIREATEYAKAQGWRVVGTYADAELSGALAKRRPEYQRMLSSAKAGEFDVLLVEDLSRLGRKGSEAARVAEEFEFRNIRVVGYGSRYDSAAEGAEVNRAFTNLKDSMERKDVARRSYRGMRGQFKRNFWTGGRLFGYGLQPVYDKGRQDAYGQPLKIGTLLVVDKDQAKVVQRIFTMYTAGFGVRAIAAALNSDGIASPGSFWKGRRVRRASGWMGSAVRGIVRNPTYTGTVRWSVKQYRLDPESETRIGRKRQEAEHLTRQDEALRIIDQATWEATQARIKSVARKWGGGANSGPHSGGRTKHVLSGLLICDSCGSHFTMADRLHYACGTVRDSHECKNIARPSRKLIEGKVLGLFRDQLLSPVGLKAFKSEVRRYYQERTAAANEAHVKAPGELAEVDARIKRLQARIKAGDPDLSADELEAALARLQDKRRTLIGIPAATRLDAKVLDMLPINARSLRREIDAGFSDPTRVTEARVVLGRLLPEGIRLRRDARGRLFAHYAVDAAALLVAPVRCGSGQRNRTCLEQAWFS